MANPDKKRKVNFGLLLAAGALILFAGSFIFYFANSFITTEREYAVYSSMEEPTLPVIYAQVEGRDINLMHGYLQDMGNEAASDSITPLPENRRLELHIKPFGNTVIGLNYEVRSLNLQHYIENTEVNVIREGEDGTQIAELPIQNMISRDTPYLLRIQLDLGERVVNYYTRIIWTDAEHVRQMMDTALDFTNKTFNYSEARDLTVYLETDPNADNSSYGNVNLKSSFSQVTWGQTGMKLTSEPELNISEFNGIMGAVEVSYETESPNEAGSPDRYYNVDEFTMRTGSERLYMMNYERNTTQIFEGNKHLFAGKRINLGITTEDRLQTAKSENGRHIVFKVNKELWSYDQTAKRAVNIFSFRSEQDTLRANYDKHNIKILEVDNEGNVDFVVYGYINRGRHEGLNGIVYYQYESGSASINELFFIPIANTYEKIAMEIDELCVKSGSGMVYIKQNDAVTAIDLTSQEMLDVTSGLTEGRYAVSRDQTMIAWLDGDMYETNNIKLMDLMSGSTQTITASEGTVLRVVAFYNQDLLYGVSGAEDRWIINQRVKGMPMSKLMIIDRNLSVIMEYHKPELYLENIRIEEDRIHLVQYRKGSSPNTYQFASKDTIVSREPQENLYTQNVVVGESETRKRIWYIELDENIKTTRSLRISAPKNISYEKSGTIELGTHRTGDEIYFYSYANGRLQGKVNNLAEAINLCYDEMGWVRDRNSVVVYNRSDRVPNRVIQDPNSAAEPLVLGMKDFTGDRITEDGYILLDAQGVELNRLMYYVSKGCPIAVWLDRNEYALIFGYDSQNIRIYFPMAEEGEEQSTIMSTEEAAAFFAGTQNDYLCFLPYEGV